MFAVPPYWFLPWLNLWPWRWKQYISLNHRWTSTKLWLYHMQILPFMCRARQSEMVRRLAHNMKIVILSFTMAHCWCTLKSLHLVRMRCVANVSDSRTASVIRVGLQSWRWRHLWNVDDTAHIHKVQTLEIRKHVNNERLLHCCTEMFSTTYKILLNFLKSSCSENLPLAIPFPVNCLPGLTASGQFYCSHGQKRKKKKKENL
jgi:hypothetical protein